MATPLFVPPPAFAGRSPASGGFRSVDRKMKKSPAAVRPPGKLGILNGYESSAIYRAKRYSIVSHLIHLYLIYLIVLRQ